MKKPFTLYGRPGSGSLAVQVALEEVGADYERIWVGTEPAEVARYKELNPTGRVPALALPDGTIMFESAAILIHLALLNPDAKLAPQPGTTRHAAFLQWMCFLSANVYEAVLRILLLGALLARAARTDATVIREQGMADSRQSHLPGQRALSTRMCSAPSIRSPTLICTCWRRGTRTEATSTRVFRRSLLTARSWPPPGRREGRGRSRGAFDRLRAQPRISSRPAGRGDYPRASTAVVLVLPELSAQRT